MDFFGVSDRNLSGLAGGAALVLLALALVLARIALSALFDAVRDILSMGPRAWLAHAFEFDSDSARLVAVLVLVASIVLALMIPVIRRVSF